MYLALAYGVPCMGLVALLYAWWRSRWILEQEAGDERLRGVARLIAEGASSFLRVEYRAVALFVLPVACLLAYVSGYAPHGHAVVGATFVMGACFSALSGWIGMRMATRANVRTAVAASRSLSEAFLVAFSGGVVMALGVVGLALLGLGVAFGAGYYALMLPDGLLASGQLRLLIEVLTGFALGAESVALFARVAGGIYTKAADIGADIVGKIEAGLPEDDPRNPATIADNVGDNVGDVAGLGAGLFGSYVATVLAAMALGAWAYVPGQAVTLVPALLPMYVAALGTLCALAVLAWVRLGDAQSSVQGLLSRANLLAVVLTGLAGYVLLAYVLPQGPYWVAGRCLHTKHLTGLIGLGLATGLLVSWITEYFTTQGHYPVDSIVARSVTGPGTNVIAGLSMGLYATTLPTLLFAVTLCVAFALGGFYGVALGAVGMMATTPMQLAIDAFGPIADNAGGIAQMGGMEGVVRERTDVLDTVGNTTAATGKGFAIASAALTSVALFAAYADAAHIRAIDVYQVPVFVALLVGAMMPMLFAAMTMGAVGQAAQRMVHEVRRQLREVPGLLEGKAAPSYDRCIAIATYAALWQMLAPGALTLLTPVVIGWCWGPTILAAYVAGVLICGVLMALFQCNAGGAWDNAKKALEEGVTLEGVAWGKGSVAHQAAVVGDTVGDPFKDTSGPSMNILIKLTAIVALLLAPHLAAPMPVEAPQEPLHTVVDSAA